MRERSTGTLEGTLKGDKLTDWMDRNVMNDSKSNTPTKANYDLWISLLTQLLENLTKRGTRISLKPMFYQ